MPRTRIEVDDSEVRALYGNASSGRRILSRSLNRTVKGVRTDVVREVSKVSGAQIKFLRRVIRTRNAKPSFLEAEINGSSRRLPVTAFGARQTKKGVTFRGKSGRRQLIEGAFIEKTIKHGYRGAFKRKFDKTKNASGRDARNRLRKNRLPVRKLQAVSVGHTLLNEPVLSRAHRSVDERWQKAVVQNIEFENAKNVKP